ncbi:MAG TPA: hypothetical protein VIE65_00225, partial [Methylobacter sp.]
MSNIPSKEKISLTINNLREAAEFAPAVRKNDEAVVEMFNSSAEFLLAAQLLLNPDHKMASDQEAITDFDAMIQHSRSNFIAAMSVIREFDMNNHEVQPDVLDNIFLASEEITRN